MSCEKFITRDQVSSQLRKNRNWTIAHGKAISEAESTLKAAGREDLLHCVKKPTELGKEYFPPTDIELAAIQVGDVVRVCTPPRYSYWDWGFNWHPLLVLKVSGDEIYGLLRGFLKEDERVTVSLAQICSIDDRSEEALAS